MFQKHFRLDQQKMMMKRAGKQRRDLQTVPGTATMTRWYSTRTSWNTRLYYYCIIYNNQERSKSQSPGTSVHTNTTLAASRSSCLSLTLSCAAPLLDAPLAHITLTTLPKLCGKAQCMLAFSQTNQFNNQYINQTYYI